ncbi:hypothetical protein KI688_002235 [Linnemannia hyalina]|uniref:C3H1-type domain-containing protein n=1 Tax=Linnemannia hyalina TaxID=64524 RepID=A0A9P7XTI2_9FUNG|nr:hypothetical protein KI688_002235 [Linnemannia hyalina]
MDYFGNSHPLHHHQHYQNQQYLPHTIHHTGTTLRQHPPARLTLAVSYPVTVPEISTRLIGATKPLNSELGTPSSLLDTTMDLGSAVSVLFSVNPPSPVESELCSDDQETIVRTWCTAGPSTEQLLGEDRAHASSCDTSRVGSATTAAISSAASAANQSGDSSGKNRTRALRRGSSESNKAELYKTELCISIHSGHVCKYGDNCQFAHSIAELQHVSRHPRYKTQLCTSFQSQGFCKYNDRCTFIHHPEEARVSLPPSLFRKTPAQMAPSNQPLAPTPTQVPTHVPNQLPAQVLSQVPHQMLAQMLSNHQTQSSTAPSSTSYPNSGTATPAQQFTDYSKMDRARAMSDPCIYTYMEGLEVPPRMGGLEQGFFFAEPMGFSMSMAMDGANPLTSLYPQQVFAPPMSNDPHEFMNQGPQQQPVPVSMRRQRRMGISYPPPEIPTDGGHPAQHRNIFDLLPHYNEYGMFDPDLAVRPAGAVGPPWMTPRGIWQPLHNNLTHSTNAGNSDENQDQIQDLSQSQEQSQSQAMAGLLQQQGALVEDECDAEWIAKLARYITTSQNDFEI